MLTLIAEGAAALRKFTAFRVTGWRLTDKQTEEDVNTGRSEWYEVQRLVFDGHDTQWKPVAHVNAYEAAEATLEVERKREPVGSYDIRPFKGFHRETLGWRIIRVTQETWKRTAVIQLKSEVINNGNPNKEVR